VNPLLSLLSVPDSSLISSCRLSRPFSLDRRPVPGFKLVGLQPSRLFPVFRNLNPFNSLFRERFQSRRLKLPAVGRQGSSRQQRIFFLLHLLSDSAAQTGIRPRFRGRPPSPFSTISVWSPFTRMIRSCPLFSGAASLDRTSRRDGTSSVVSLSNNKMRAPRTLVFL